eukprot:TRINITY_DN18247_c0_g1_i1.p2 TRINITY_DN18247_c0_g1~~TRINITY_DN18247_c0_g1_i1.p2  ORF type:complete len:322 (+),score=84.26 TRINITY_DN18247_c0_g1_i1:1403-2368(+)
MSNKIAIIGAGLVGRSWSIVFGRGGYKVSIYDNDQAQLQLVLPDVTLKLKALQEANLLKGQTADQILSRISTSNLLSETLSGAIYAQECVPESLEMKAKVFKDLDEKAEVHTILASSTSSIPASRFTESLTHRSRCIVAHPINPPHIVPLVEIVPSPWTDPSVVSKTRSIMTEVGNAPIVLKKEVLGFAQNRLQYALLAEAMRLVEDGVLSPGDVDTAVMHGLAARWSFMGPFQTIDLNAPKGVGDYCSRYLGGIYNVLKEEDNSRQFSQETVLKIEEHQRSLYPQSDIPLATKWRDARLMALATHHVQTQQIDEALFPKK